MARGRTVTWMARGGSHKCLTADLKKLTKTWKSRKIDALAHMSFISK